MNLNEFYRDYWNCPGYQIKQIGKKQLRRCDYCLPTKNGYITEQIYNKHIITTWDSYDTTIIGVDYRVKINGKATLYVGAECTYSPTTRAHTGYIARELGFSYYDFKAALNSPCEVVATNKVFAVVYDPNQTLFNDQLNHSSAGDLLHYYTHASKHGFLRGGKSC